MKQNNILQKSGWTVLAVLSFAPVLFWAFGAPLSARFSTLPLATRSLGDVAGLCGMAMFSLVLILSARLKLFEKLFKGINDAYVAHHFFGGLAFSMLLFHPLLLAYNYLAVSFRQAALFLLPSANWPQNFGIIALLLMIITLVITFYAKLKYQVWRFTHKFMGMAFLFAFLHIFFIGADVSSNLYLKIYLFVLGACAVAVYFYRSIFARYLVKTYDYAVKDIKKYEDKIWEIELEPQGKEIKFAAGQFAFVKFLSKELTGDSHPFSFSSANASPLKIAIKELGDYTNKIGLLKPGDLAKIEGPFGAFCFEKYGPKQVWIAGGVGITPFLSMLRALTNSHQTYNIHLYYSVRDEHSMAFKNEIEQLAQKNNNLKVNFWVASKDGLITAGSIAQNTPDLKSREVLLCGPQIMMDSLKKQLADYGVKKGNIHTEEFMLY